MKAVFTKEFKSYFNSATGYIFMAVFLLISGIFFSLANIITQQPNTFYNPVLSNITFIFLILVPVITMRTIAEETHQKTDQLLYTTPLSLTEVILGKYFAAVALFLVTLLVTCIYPLILSIYGTVDTWSIIGSYIGFALFGSSLIAIGVFISSLTDNQVISAVGTFGALLFIWILDWVQQGLPTSRTAGIVFAAILVLIICLIVYSSTHNIYMSGIVAIAGAAIITIIYFAKKTLFEGFTVKFFGWFSLLKRYDNFSMGILSISDIVYYITFSAAFIFLTIRMIDKRRWS